MDEIDNFIEKYSFSKSTLSKAECLNRPVTRGNRRNRETSKRALA